MNRVHIQAWLMLDIHVFMLEKECRSHIITTIVIVSVIIVNYCELLWIIVNYCYYHDYYWRISNCKWYANDISERAAMSFEHPQLPPCWLWPWKGDRKIRLCQNDRRKIIQKCDQRSVLDFMACDIRRPVIPVIPVITRACDGGSLAESINLEGLSRNVSKVSRFKRFEGFFVRSPKRERFEQEPVHPLRQRWGPPLDCYCSGYETPAENESKRKPTRQMHSM